MEDARVYVLVGVLKPGTRKTIQKDQSSIEDREPSWVLEDMEEKGYRYIERGPVEAAARQGNTPDSALRNIWDEKPEKN